MKRTNVVLDEKLLEEARKVSGEKTYSATITKALEGVVKRERFWDAYDKFAEEAAKGDFFWPNYIEEMRPKAPPATKKRLSAHVQRAPRTAKRKSGKRKSAKSDRGTR
jgi:hypothetical protein